MRVVKIGALWCSGCLIMNNIWNKIKKEKNIETIELDYDMDSNEVKKYNVGNILPVFIFYKNNKEVKRIIGETKEKSIMEVIEELEK